MARRPRRVLTKRGKAFRLEGLPELQANVDKILKAVGGRKGQAVGEEIKHILMGAALVIRDEAKDLVPVRTGLLKSAIFAAYGDPRKPDVLIGVNYKIAPHAHLVEYGARDGEMPPQPYMRPAVQATRAKAANIIAEGVRRLIEKTLP